MDPGQCLVLALFVLGADDPEMRAIEKTLSAYGHDFVYATFNGARCNAGNAYSADDIDANGKQFVMIEADFKNPRDVLKRIDLPPENFFQASSIGQLYEYLEIGDVPHEMLVLAAERSPLT
ncbi:Hypothetical protein POVR1_LOCUS150 [uncultured virus]|nr:Hypothetical protein POVR1_LOCUS150 [uncultured virus]